MLLTRIKHKISSNQKGYHYISYCFTLMCMGAAISSLGPLIPYLSYSSGRSEAEYSFLFLARAVGFLACGLSVKFIQKKFSFHQILLYTSVCILAFMFGFSSSNYIYFQTVLNVCISFCLCLIMITINVLIMNIQKNQYQQEWLNFSHGIFGIGGLIGPILVRVFQYKTFLIIGIVFTLISPIYYILQTPQDHKQISQKLQNQQAIQQMLNAHHQGIVQKLIKKQKFAPLPLQIQRVMCFMFFAYIGIETAFGGWISPYAVLQNVSLKNEATIFITYFYATMTIFRFIFCILSSASVEKLNFLLKGLLISSIVIVVMVQFNLIYLVCILSSLLFGACTSSMYAVMLSLPWQKGYEVNTKQNGTFVLCASLGEGVVSVIVGYLMNLIDLNILFYMIFLSSLALMLSFDFIIKVFENHRIQEPVKLQLQNMKK